MEEFDASVDGTDDGDFVAVRAYGNYSPVSWSDTTPIRIITGDGRNGGIEAFFSIEQAKQHMEHVRQAIKFLENS